MDVRDGYIVGIHDYCDQWCDACGFTSRCRAFVMEAEHEARCDPAMQPVIDGAPVTGNAPPPVPEWLQALIEEAAAARYGPSVRGGEHPWGVPSARDGGNWDQQPLMNRVTNYRRRCAEWVAARPEHGRVERRDPSDPVAVICWFATLLPTKIRRAVTALAEHDADHEGPADHDGSAKVALLGIDRSREAWLELVKRKDVLGTAAEPFVSDLVWMQHEVQRLFPGARAFVRPGFDEPEAVAQLGVWDDR